MSWWVGVCLPFCCMYTYLGVEFLGHVITRNILERVKNLPDPGVEPGSPALQADCLLSEPPGKPNTWRVAKLPKRLHYFPHLPWPPGDLCIWGGIPTDPRLCCLLLLPFDSSHPSGCESESSHSLFFLSFLTSSLPSFALYAWLLIKISVP